jgi:hypothetical protein
MTVLMMSGKMRTVFSWVILSIATVGCGGSMNPPPPPDAGTGEPPKLSEVQTKVFNVSCTFSSCHDMFTKQKKLDLQDASAVWAHIVNVPAEEKPAEMLVVPGFPGKSYLMDKLTGTSTLPPGGMPVDTIPWTFMPPPSVGGMLEADRRQLVHDWIEAGAQNN